MFSLTADYEMEEETSDEGETTDDEVVVKKPQGISLFMFVLIALTGGVLFILNITGVLCYLRRRSFFQGLSGKLCISVSENVGHGSRNWHLPSFSLTALQTRLIMIPYLKQLFLHFS